MAYEAAEPLSDDKKSDADDEYTVEQWLAEIDNAERDTRNFRTAGKRITKRYLDVRDDSGDEGASKYNLFTTNTNIMQAVLYARQPDPMVERQHQDFNDEIARISAEMLHRILKVQDKSDMDEALRLAVHDRLIPGIGQIWLRYCPDIEHCKVDAVYSPTGEMLSEAFEYDRVVNETVTTDYVYWDDFFWSPARTWGEVWWIGRRIWMLYNDVVKRWGKEKADMLNYSRGRTPEKSAGKGDRKRYAQVFEIWCKRTKSIHWVSKGCDQILESQGDPLQLRNFWPCPPPLRGIHSTNTVTPRADYTMVQDQYEQLDVLNARIACLVDACRVVGVFDKANEELRQVITGSNNKMIPVDSWAMFAEKGGIKGSVEWLPLDAIVAAIDKLRQYRADLVQQIYELTGMSDIIRGATKASETATAQELKAQFASMRLQAVQMDIARFIESGLQIKAEIMARKFSDESFITQSNLEWIPEPMKQQLFPEAIKLIRMPNLMWFRIMVTADALAVPDFNAERDAKIQFLRAIGQFVEQIVPMAQAMPGSVPFFMKMIQWVASGFRVSKNIEGVIDQAIQDVEKALANPSPPKPSPEEIKAQTEQQKSQQEMQNTQQEHALNMQSMQAEMQADMQIKGAEMQMKDREMAMKDQFNQRDFRRKMAESAMRLIESKEKRKESRKNVA